MTTWEKFEWFVIGLLTIVFCIVAYDWNCGGRKLAYYERRDCIEKCQSECEEHEAKREKETL